MWYDYCQHLNKFKVGAYKNISILGDTALHAYEDTINILNFAFDNYSLYNIEETELELDLNFPPLFTQTAEFSAGVDMLIHVGKNSNVVLPISADFTDAVKTISYQPVEDFVHGDNIIGRITYQFAGRTIGYADIIYDNPEYPVTRAEFEALWPSYMIPPDIVFQNETETGTPVSPGQPGSSASHSPGESSEKTDSRALLPLILGIGAAVLILLAGGFLIFASSTRRRRRRSHRYNDSRIPSGRSGAGKKGSFR